MSNLISEDCSSGLHDCCTPYVCECHKEYHTMLELYEHRHTLFCALLKIYDNYITPLANARVKCWKSKLHYDGTMFDGWFIAGMTIVEREFNAELPPIMKQITYHLPLEWWDKFKIIELSKAPPWDGHDSNEVLRRLMAL